MVAGACANDRPLRTCVSTHGKSEETSEISRRLRRRRYSFDEAPEPIGERVRREFGHVDLIQRDRCLPGDRPTVASATRRFDCCRLEVDSLGVYPAVTVHWPS